MKGTLFRVVLIGFVVAAAGVSGADAQQTALAAGAAVGATEGMVREAGPAVAARDLARGEVLALEDIARGGAADAGSDATAASLVGWTTRRMISAGEPLQAPAVSPPHLVKAGDAVHAIWRGKTIELRVAGTAAGSAAMGERVLVRIDARRRLEGVVIGPALVQLESLDRGR